MTEEEFNKLPFRFASSLAMDNKHCTTYVNDDYNISICTHTIKREDFTFGRSYTHYLYKGVVYKSKSKFLDAIKDLKFNHLFLKSNERRSNVNSSSEK